MASARLTHGFLFVQDLEAAIEFYSGAFGLVAQPSSDPGYVMMLGAEGASLALHRTPQEHAVPLATPPSWRVASASKLCFATDDLEALCQGIVERGGQVAEPWAWDGRRFCEAVDTEGNLLQIYTER